MAAAFQFNFDLEDELEDLTIDDQPVETAASQGPLKDSSKDVTQTFGEIGLDVLVCNILSPLTSLLHTLKKIA